MTTKNAKIIVIDDDTFLLHITQALLAEEGYIVATSMARAGAYQLILSERPALVIVDIHTPEEEEALVLLDMLRMSGATRDIPVIICTGDARFLKQNSDNLFAAACSVVGRPYDIDEMLASVERALAGTRQPAPSTGTALCPYLYQPTISTLYIDRS